MYPRSAAGGDASAASTSMPDRCEPSRARSSTEPTTRYEDGPLDALAIALFNRKLLAAVETARDGRGAPLTAEEKNALPRAGFDRLVALADGIGSSGRSPAAQRAVVLETLRIAPKGTMSVSSFLKKGADGLVAGGKKGIYTVMYFTVARKPPTKSAKPLPSPKKAPAAAAAQ